MHKLDLDTPTLLVDLDVLDRNILEYAAVARNHGVNIRPHAKTSKMPEIVQRQIDAGAIGICVATLHEASTFIKEGLTDLLIPYPIVGKDKLRQLVQLMGKANIAVNVDNLEVAEGLGRAVHKAGKQLSVLVKVNLGFNRFGLPPDPDQLLSFIHEMEKNKNIRFQGLMSFIGGLSNRTLPEIQEIGRKEGMTMTSLAQALRMQGVSVESVSVGSTSTARYAAEVIGVTEIRPGTYVFNDVTMIDRGVCEESGCALTVLGTVVTKPTNDRVIIDLGSKTLTFALASPDGGFGLVKNGDGLRITSLSEEHGVLEAPGVAARFSIGQKLEIIPNVCSEVVNGFRQAVGIIDDRVSTVWPIPARGYGHDIQEIS